MTTETGAGLLFRSHPVDESGETVAVSAAQAGWRYVSFAAHLLADGQRLCRTTGDEETAFILLAGGADVCLDGRRQRLRGRQSVFDAAPPVTILAGVGAEVEIQARGPLLLAIAAAPAGERTVSRLIDVDEVRIERRGTGSTARTVKHLIPPESEAGRLIVVEVVTPGGNWSSYPPHKHDTEDPPQESYLEEIYYYAFDRPQGYALQRIYTPDRTLDIVLAPGDGDLVLVPRGYHMVGAPAGYDCYYLNVMAGPTRAWNFSLDPDHAWLMDWDPGR